MPGSLLFDVCEDLQRRCRADGDVLKAAMHDMVKNRWTTNDIGMHVACCMPAHMSFPTNAGRIAAVICDLIRRCLEDEEFLRVTVSTDTGGWTDDELQQYADTHLGQPAPAPAPSNASIS